MTPQERKDLLELFRAELKRVEDVLTMRLTLLELELKRLTQQRPPLDARGQPLPKP